MTPHERVRRNVEIALKTLQGNIPGMPDEAKGCLIPVQALVIANSIASLLELQRAELLEAIREQRSSP